jgi:hypothetical protein
MSEFNRLRCQLRAVNIEYSALVRRKAGKATYARMAGLRNERRVLMARIAVWDAKFRQHTRQLTNRNTMGSSTRTSWAGAAPDPWV